MSKPFSGSHASSESESLPSCSSPLAEDEAGEEEQDEEQVEKQGDGEEKNPSAAVLACPEALLACAWGCVARAQVVNRDQCTWTR